MQFIGLDPSLAAFGAVRYQPGVGELATTFTTPPAGTLTERAWRNDAMIGQLDAWLPANDEIGGICIEGRSYGSSGRGVFDRENLRGAIEAWIVCDRALSIVEVAPHSLKLFVVGKGAGKGVGKKAVQAAILKRYGLSFFDDNEADAYVLARMAACHFGAEEPTTDFQRRALEKLK